MTEPDVQALIDHYLNEHGLYEVSSNSMAKKTAETLTAQRAEIARLHTIIAGMRDAVENTAAPFEPCLSFGSCTSLRNRMILRDAIIRALPVAQEGE